MSISSIGSTKLSTPNGLFHLKDILHVPAITKNLLSVHKFALHIGVCLEFHPYHVYVKDPQLGKVLLQGKFKDGQYELPMDGKSVSGNISAYTAEKVTFGT